MKRISKLLMMAAIASVGTPAFAAAITEPSSSLMSEGRWVKIRVRTDGVYQLTDAELMNLGFSNPAKVKVYGYSPTYLLTHDFGVMPADLPVMPSVHENGKVVFYAKSNTDIAADVWNDSTTLTEHERHSASDGATYFLSDVDGPDAVIGTISAPDATLTAAEYHQSAIYFEEDKNNLGVGGSFFVGDVVTSQSASMTYPFELKKVATPSARLVYQGVMIASSATNNYLVTSYSPEIKSSASTGSTASFVSGKVAFRPFRRLQDLEVPVSDKSVTYNITFTPNQALNGFKQGGIDYWSIVFNRNNDLKGESQMIMHYTDASNPRFAVYSMDAGSNWHFWDVTSPLDIKECELARREGGALVGAYTAAGAKNPAVIAAFNTAASLPRPEIVGVVENQNLHSLTPPDMVVLTSGMLLDVAEEAADVHRRLQGYDVLVVDQEQVFNEYGSGNVSPESVRRFMHHLAGKSGSKLKALMIIGPAVTNNAREISPDAVGVVTPQTESLVGSYSITSSFFTDGFFGRFGELPTSGLWATRHIFYRVMGSDMGIAVGRLPFSSPTDIRNYMAKVEEYMTGAQVKPAVANVVAASDYESSASAEPHYGDVELCLTPMAESLDKEITVTRPASNFYSSANNTVNRRVMQSALENGAGLFLYFGHGLPSAFGDVSGSSLMSIQDAKTYSTPGSYPFAFIGSCNTARCDVNPDNVVAALLANPHGGMLGIVSSTREVFQNWNPELGQIYVKHYHAAVNGDLSGDIFRRAHVEAINTYGTDLGHVKNDLCYLYFGDPAIPLRKPTHTVNISKVNEAGGKTLYINGANAIEGTVNNANGAVDTSFDGNIVLTIYDSPETKKNLVAASSSAHSMYQASIVMDQSILKQVVAEVKGGRFVCEFNAPSPTILGEQRIAAYAYSNDGKSTAIGYVKELNSVTDATRDPYVSAGGISITAMDAVNSAANGSTSMIIKSEINAPGGLTATGSIGFPMRFTLDGKAKTEVTRLLRAKGNGNYEFEYVTNELASGRHIASLEVYDEADNSDYRELEFTLNDAPAVSMTATSDKAGTLTVMVDHMSGAESTVVVETLAGDLVRSQTVTSFPVELTEIPAGNYRVYTRHKSASYHTSSPRVTVTVD